MTVILKAQLNDSVTLFRQFYHERRTFKLNKNFGYKMTKKPTIFVKDLDIKENHKLHLKMLLSNLRNTFHALNPSTILCRTKSLDLIRKCESNSVMIF